MSVGLALSLASSAVGVLAVVVLADEFRQRRSAVAAGRRPVASDPGAAARWAIAATVCLVVLATSGWVVPAIVVGMATWSATRRWQRRDRDGGDLARLDALASWIENLRDVLVAGDQPIGAIAATVPTCPAPIKPAVRRLSAALGRQEPDAAFRRFADDLDDPLGDLVAIGLLIAVQRGARTAAVLDALAEQARRQADRRRLVEAERAPMRREVHLLTLIMGSLVVGVLVFGRADYLRPYASAGGQLFLGVVIALYALLLLRVQRLASAPRPSRIIVSPASADRHLSRAATS